MAGGRTLEICFGVALETVLDNPKGRETFFTGLVLQYRKTHLLGFRLALQT